jgi:hypothetical protein
VKSKIKKGYSENENSPSISKELKIGEPINSKRAETILLYLDQAQRGVYSRNWKVSRIIQRAGQLNITKSAMLIAPFVNSKDDFEQYAAINVLAQFNYNSAEKPVLDVFNQHQLNNMMGRAAASFIIKLKDSPCKQDVFSYLEQNIPSDILANVENSKSINSKLPVLYLNQDKIDVTLLYRLYLLSYKYSGLREPIYNVLQNIPLKVNTFKSVRYIYRAAILLNDFQFFALVAKKTAINNAVYSSDYAYYEGDWINTEEEKKKKNPRIAFSKKTKNYFNAVSYNSLYNYGLSDKEAYIKFAKEILCSLDDTIDNEQIKKEEKWEYNYTDNNYNVRKFIYPKYSEFLSLMYILYGNSLRFERTKTKWHYSIEITDLNAIPREEMYPEIWNTKPQDVIYILAHAKSEEAIGFSLKIIKDNPKFLDDIPTDLFNKLLNHYDTRVIELLVDVLEKKYALTRAENGIIFTLLNSNSEKGTQLALKWLNIYESQYFIDSLFITRLVLIENLELNKWLYNAYKDFCKYNFPIPVKEIFPLFDTPNQYSSEFLEAVNKLISETKFGELITDVTASFIQTLLNTDLVSNKVLAISLGKISVLSTYDLFKDNIQSYLDSEEQQIRHAGLELLSHFPDDYLLNNHSLITNYCFSPHIEVRTSIRPTIGRLIDINEDFKNNLLERLLSLLVEKETYEGIHENCYEILTTYYGKNIAGVTKEYVLVLLLSKYEFAQKLGTELFTQNIAIKSLTIFELVSLSTSDIKKIREDLCSYFETDTARANNELHDLLRIFNSDWKDIRLWGFKYLESYIKFENWDLNTLLYVCDHPKEDVQVFGRKMIVTHFKEERGLELLLHLSEHPSKTMQFFATNYLDTYIKDNPEKIVELEAFFKTTLFNINTNRPSKARVFSFLEKESVKSEKVAVMTIKLLNSILVTKSIKDKSSCLDILLAINEEFPELTIPIKIKL